MEQSKKLLSKLEYIEKVNIIGQQPEYMIIWLHGLGADYNDFVPIIKELNLNICVKFVFPNAPERPITINNGYIMRAWYDIRDLTKLGDTVDRYGINDSVSQIEDLIALFMNEGWKSEKIILAGFSQGGVISYITALTTKYKLGGVLALSCYLPGIDELVNKDLVVNKRTAILACHGKHDMVVPYDAGLSVYNRLRGHGYNISWMHYPIAHGVCSEELADISLWLKDILFHIQTPV
ncbi:MAG: carboxylesterase [Proteobacteria bacterium]|jgi:phospholipase/carboxylesterase|nr:carboxylesterase [Pseudomonadota bacterium]